MNWQAKEPLEAKTVGEAIGIFFHGDRFYNDNSRIEKLYRHDFLHALLRAKINSDTAEEIVAIYQAILLGRAEFDLCNPSPPGWKSDAEPPSLEQIRSVTVPGARAFVNATVERLNGEHELDEPTKRKFAIRNPLNPEQIAEHYQKALILRRLFEQIHEPLGAIPIDELRALPFPPLQELVKQVDSIYAIAGGRVEPAGNGLHNVFKS